MKALGEKKVIDWEAFGDGDFTAPNFVFEFDRKTFEFIRTELLEKFYCEREQLLKKIDNLENKLDLFMGSIQEKLMMI
jgi:hypothetical protein